MLCVYSSLEMHTLICWGEADLPRPWMPIRASMSWFSSSVKVSSCCSTTEALKRREVGRVAEGLKGFEEKNLWILCGNGGGHALMFDAWNLSAIVEWEEGTSERVSDWVREGVLVWVVDSCWPLLVAFDAREPRGIST